MCNVDGPPKERFHNPTSLGFWGAFDFALDAVTSVVDHDVQSSKMLAGRLERRSYLGLVGDIKRQNQNL